MLLPAGTGRLAEVTPWSPVFSRLHVPAAQAGSRRIDFSGWFITLVPSGKSELIAQSPETQARPFLRPQPYHCLYGCSTRLAL